MDARVYIDFTSSEYEFIFAFAALQQFLVVSVISLMQFAEEVCCSVQSVMM